MLPGPVFKFELLTTSRRPRYYLVRALYGLILLVILWQNYQSSFWWRLRQGQKIGIQEMARFAESCFASLVAAQIVAILVLTPVLVAGVIADEKQRKTLHYLLASRLTSPEIVLGKLLARLLHIGIFLAIGFPVISLLTLFGGIDPLLILLAECGSLTIAFFLCGLCLMVSTHSRRVREAILGVFGLELLWLIIPWLLDVPLRFNWPIIHSYINPVNQWVLASNPFYPLAMPTGGARWMNSLLDRSLWMMGLQLAFGSLFVLIAVWRLRPIFRARGETRPEALACPGSATAYDSSPGPRAANIPCSGKRCISRDPEAPRAGWHNS